MSKWQWLLKEFGSRLWVRASLFCVLAIATAFAAFFLKGFIPEDTSRKVGAEAVDGILQIIASSMLAVTTFSLSTMVAAYSAATSNVTPRATQLLLRDRTAQNALSVFIGAFLYSLVGIIALSMGIYGDNGRLVLFAVTIAVVILIIGVLLQWIHYLSRLGRVSETIDMVEHAAERAFKERMEMPYLGGQKCNGDPGPEHRHAVVCARIGYLQHIDMPALSHLAEQAEAVFHLHRLPGAFNDGVTPLLSSTVELDDDSASAVCNAFSIGDNRSFDQDPRFGLVVLSEIASRALSPAINDPGTAIDVLGTSVRLLAPWVADDLPEPKPHFSNLHVPALRLCDLFDDIFAGIARDGASMVQVGIRLQKALLALSHHGGAPTREQARRLSTYALAYADKHLTVEAEKEALARLAERINDR